MATYLWRKIKGGSPSARVLSAYVALVLALAVAGPGLAVFATESEVPEEVLAEEALLEEPVLEEPVAPEAGILTLFSSAVTALDVPASDDPSTSGIVPEYYDGNPVLCVDGYRLDPPVSGTINTTVNGTPVTIEVTITEKEGYGQVFSFTSDYPIVRVVAKGGSDANIYYYDPDTYGDGELHSPVNPSGKYADLSHIDFCFGVPQEPETGDLIVYKFEDLNENGEYDEGEPMLEGWEFTLVRQSPPIVEIGASAIELVGTDETDENGEILWTGLTPGDNYNATETLKDGWINTTPLSQDAEVVAGETTELWFGNVRKPAEPEAGDLIVYKFEDLNKNGIHDEGEPMLESWEFTVAGPEFSDSGMTDADGELLFSDLLPGEYTATETLKDGWINTTPLSQVVDVVAGETAELWFGNIREPEDPEEPFKPFTPEEPFLPFTGGEFGLILGAAAAAATAGTAMRLKGRRRS